MIFGSAFRMGEKMPRGKRIVITSHQKDPIVHKLKALKPSELKSRRAAREMELREAISSIVRVASQLYEQDKLDKERLRSMGLLTIDEAYEEVKKAGIPISARAFGGRIERRSIRSEKIGKKRLIPKPVISDWIALHREYYSIKEAYEKLKPYEPELNLRAFIGRVEKNAVPSIKIGTGRWIPREAIDALTHVAQNYYSVPDAIALLHQKGIKIKRNAFERRLDRNRIPHEKIGGRRVIHKDVMEELVQKELALQAKKASSANSNSLGGISKPA